MQAFMQFLASHLKQVSALVPIGGRRERTRGPSVEQNWTPLPCRHAVLPEYIRRARRRWCFFRRKWSTNCQEMCSLWPDMPGIPPTTSYEPIVLGQMWLCRALEESLTAAVEARVPRR